MNLLAVDWDYFCPFEGEGGCAPSHAWGHFETPYHVHEVWYGRAVDFLLSGRTLPTTSGLEEDFWSRFVLTPDAGLFYADSNAFACHERVRRGVRAVWLFDAHHDCGYGGDPERGGGEVSCDDWMCAYHREGAALHVRYPRWRADAERSEPRPRIPVDMRVDDEKPLTVAFDRVFVCRSGAWTPPWLDGRFFELLRRVPVRDRVSLDGLRRRSFDAAALRRRVAAERPGWTILRTVQGSPPGSGDRALGSVLRTLSGAPGPWAIRRAMRTRPTGRPSGRHGWARAGSRSRPATAPRR